MGGELGRRSNSRRVSSTSAPALVTRRAALISMSPKPSVRWVSGSPVVRRSTAFTRATASMGENGLVT